VDRYRVSECGFTLRNVIFECAWIFNKKGGSFLPKDPRISYWEYKGADLTTPLGFCAWLSKKRLCKSLKTKQRKAAYDKKYRSRRWANDFKYREATVERRRRNRLKNVLKERVMANAYVKRKMESDPMYKLMRNCRNRFRRVFDLTKTPFPHQRFMDFIVSTPLFLKEYIENKFEPSMGWHNYGKEWHIDHKKPLKHFNLKDKAQAQLAFNYINLQPTSKAYNLSKGARWAD